MKGLLADVNVEGHLPYIRRLLDSRGLWIILVEFNLRLVTFRDLQMPRNLDDRALWNLCQEDGWLLLTENRNHDGPDSLQATLNDSWLSGRVPVLTLANKRRFEHDPEYAARVADTIADLLFGVAAERQFLDQPTIFLPR